MIVRVNKTSNYTVISNNVFKDQNLSLKAKGLLTTILSLPDNWKYSIEGLTRLCADGRNTVATAINELIKAGYIVRTQKFDESGKFSGYIYDIYEEIPSKIADLSYAEKPFTEKPFTENQGQLNTNISNTNIVNTNNIDIPPISPFEELFNQFWQAYPRKASKKDAFKAFKAIKNIEKLLPDILSDIEIKRKSESWTKDKGQFIPYPATYLRGERWNDSNDMIQREQIASSILKNRLGNYF